MNTHLLPVPFEIAELINSFAYYDWNTWTRLEKERLFMEDLIYRMMYCCNNPERYDDYYYYYDDDDNALIMWLTLPDEDGREPQFQPRFCKKCGNYIFCKPLCTC